MYNQSRERFVATGVEAVNASDGGAETRLRSLEPGTGAGLWILPCPDISPTSIRIPIDLVYLNDEGAVLTVVESFPLGGSALSSTAAGSVLALPENTVTAGEIRVGDRLIVSTAEEMKQHLQNIKEAKAAAQEALSMFLKPSALPPGKEQTGATAEPETAFVLDPAPPAPADTLLQGAILAPPVKTSAPFEPVWAAPPVEAAPAKAEPAVFHAEIAGAELPARQEQASPPRSENQPWKKKKEPKNWLARWLQDEPEDPRNTSRESLPGLIAYFFTGGTPVAHPVRDMSPTGMYIVTEERWYPGTVVRITVTDRHNPTADRSLTVNATAVRAGTDGVGFQFVLDENIRRKSLTTERMEVANGMDPAEIEEFLHIYRTPPQA